MPYATQTRLLTYSNDLMGEPIGGPRFFSFWNVIAASNRDVESMVGVGSFRHDLFGRFRMRIRIPSLRERPADERRRLIDFAAQDPAVNPVASVRGIQRRHVTHIEDQAFDALLAHEFSDGNFRELEQLMHSAIWRARRFGRSTIRLTDLDIRPPRFRGEADQRVFRGTRDAEGSVRCESLAELRRLADQTDRVIVHDGEDGYSLTLDGVTYTAAAPID